MHLCHAYSISKNISNSIMEGNFTFNLSDKMSLTLSIEHIEKFIEDGFNFPYNFREYKQLVLKSIQVTENFWLQRSLLQHFDESDLDITFDVETQKLVYTDKEDFNSAVINEYFSKVYPKLESYVLNKKDIDKKSPKLEFSSEGISLSIDGFKLIIDKQTKDLIYSELSKYFNDYYEATLVELKSRIVNKDTTIDFEFLSTVGLSTVKHMTVAKELTFEDMKNVIDLLIPEKFCDYRDAM